MYDVKYYLQGYALIEYENFEEAEKAIAAMDGGELLTQTVNVDWAFSKGPFRRRNNRRRYASYCFQHSDPIIWLTEKYDCINIGSLRIPFFSCSRL